MLVAKNLSKSFKEVNALNNISLAVQEGELYGLLGPNGAGKNNNNQHFKFTAKAR